MENQDKNTDPSVLETTSLGTRPKPNFTRSRDETENETIERERHNTHHTSHRKDIK